MMSKRKGSTPFASGLAKLREAFLEHTGGREPRIKSVTLDLVEAAALYGERDQVRRTLLEIAES